MDFANLFPELSCYRSVIKLVESGQMKEDLLVKHADRLFPLHQQLRPQGRVLQAQNTFFINAALASGMGRSTVVTHSYGKGVDKHQKLLKCHNPGNSLSCAFHLLHPRNKIYLLTPVGNAYGARSQGSDEGRQLLQPRWSPCSWKSSKKTHSLQYDPLMAETALHYNSSGQLHFVWLYSQWFWSIQQLGR